MPKILEGEIAMKKKNLLIIVLVIIVIVGSIFIALIMKTLYQIQKASLMQQMKPINMDIKIYQNFQKIIL